MNYVKNQQAVKSDPKELLIIYRVYEFRERHTTRKKGVKMKKLLCFTLLFLLFWSTAGVALAQPGNRVSYPEATAQPLVDGAFTSSGEYAAAWSVPSIWGRGTLYFQHTHDWAPPGKPISYPGTTTFFTYHDIWAFTNLDLFDLNYLEFNYGGTKIEIWVFLPGDMPDDSAWLPLTGLGNTSLKDAAGNINDDGGFIVRLNGDPSTDKQWRPGDPEPGDPGWNFANYYGAFARGAFNNSAFTTGMRSTPNTMNENYEFSVTLDNDKGIPLLDGNGDGNGGGPVPPDCLTIEWEKKEVKIKVKDPKNGDPTEIIKIEWVPHAVIVPHPQPPQDPGQQPDPEDIFPQGDDGGVWTGIDPDTGHKIIIPDTIRVFPGSRILWLGSLTLQSLGIAQVEIIVPPGPFGNAWNSGRVALGEPILSPHVANRPGTYKYVINYYNAGGDLVQSIDPYIQIPVPIGYNIYWLIFTAIFLMLAGGYLISRRRRKIGLSQQ